MNLNRDVFEVLLHFVRCTFPSQKFVLFKGMIEFLRDFKNPLKSKTVESTRCLRTKPVKGSGRSLSKAYRTSIAPEIKLKIFEF